MLCGSMIVSKGLTSVGGYGPRSLTPLSTLTIHRDGRVSTSEPMGCMRSMLSNCGSRSVSLSLEPKGAPTFESAYKGQFALTHRHLRFVPAVERRSHLSYIPLHSPRVCWQVIRP